MEGHLKSNNIFTLKDKDLQLISYNFKYKKKIILDLRDEMKRLRKEKSMINCFKCDETRAILILLISKNIFLVDIYTLKIIKIFQLCFGGKDKRPGKLKDFCYSSENRMVILAYEGKKRRKDVGIYFFKIQDLKNKCQFLNPLNVLEYNSKYSSYFNMSLCFGFSKLLIILNQYQESEKNLQGQIYELYDLESNQVTKKNLIFSEKNY